MRLVPLALTAAAACVLAACSSSGSSPSSSAATTTPPATTASTSVVPVVTTPASSTAASTTAKKTTAAPSSSSRAPSTSASRAPTSVPFTTTCRSLSVDVLKGGAIRGMEIAAMQFTNNGNSACTITGAPTATLLRNGAAVGSPSTPTAAAAKPYTLQPGEYGEALLRDYSTCDAPLSDSLRLRGPSRNGIQGKTVTQPIKLRACTLRVAPVGEPS